MARYDRRVGFERFQSEARNAFNEPVGAWVLLGQTFASRSDVRDMEKISAGRETAALVSRFEVRSSALTRSLTTADRMVLHGAWGADGAMVSGSVWDIEGIKEAAGARHAVLEITAVLSLESQV
ncbi:head-tail adaptor protein [Primorskyibacter sp. 2E107]|uniref:head-tail adaptor protein n=1 Tax=Primorskyibacter sp. 2E107 TaxID=3403458 RepID=UPI003AF47BB6